MGRYTLYTGKFPCHTCGAVVATLRHYPETKDLTWVCNEKHMTSVSLEIKKRTKKDYDRKI